MIRSLIERLATYVGEDSGETSEIILKAVEKRLEDVPPWIEAMYEIQPEKCRGCECSHIVYSDETHNTIWECELKTQGEPCYLDSLDGSEKK